MHPCCLFCQRIISCTLVVCSPFKPVGSTTQKQAWLTINSQKRVGWHDVATQGVKPFYFIYFMVPMDFFSGELYKSAGLISQFLFVFCCCPTIGIFPWDMEAEES